MDTALLTFIFITQVAGIASLVLFGHSLKAMVCHQLDDLRAKEADHEKRLDNLERNIQESEVNTWEG